MIPRPTDDHRPDAVVLAFMVPASLESLAFVRCALGVVLDRRRTPGEPAGRMMLAAGEAVSNAIEHGSPDHGGKVEVCVMADDAVTVLVVTDQGRPGARPVIDVDAPIPAPSSLRGRGMLIMRSLADDLSIRPVGNGTSVSMSFLRVHPPHPAP